MIRLLIFVLSFISIIATANAAEPQRRGFYIGGSAGVSELDDDGLFDGFSLDDTDTAIGIMAGYKVNNYFSVEARYTTLGTFTVSDNYYGVSEDIDIDALSIHAVGTIPFGTSGWAIFGQLGIASISADCSDCSDETAGAAGIGVQYSFTESLSVAAQIDAYAWEETGYWDDYTIAVATTQIALRYIF